MFSELIALSCYVAFVFYTFCDGFGLHWTRKIFWAIYFLIFSYISYWAEGHFDVPVIVMLGSLLAFALSFFQKNENRIRKYQ